MMPFVSYHRKHGIFARIGFGIYTCRLALKPVAAKAVFISSQMACSQRLKPNV